MRFMDFITVTLVHLLLPFLKIPQPQVLVIPVFYLPRTSALSVLLGATSLMTTSMFYIFVANYIMHVIVVLYIV